MTYQFNVNNVYSSNAGANAIFLLKETLVSAGWTVSKSSDGVVTDVTGDNISTVSSLLNANGWILLTRPDNEAQFCFFKATSNNQRWYVSYSVDSLFTSGTRTTAPTATNDGYVYYTTTADNFANGTFSVVADNAAPYGWCVFGWNGTTVVGMIVYEPMAAGSYNPLDTDPYVMSCIVPYEIWRISDTGDTDATNSRAKGWTGPYSTGTWGAIPGSKYNDGDGGKSFPTGCGVNPYTGSGDMSISIPFSRNAAQGGKSAFKGFSSMILWTGTTRAVKSTLTEGTTTRIVFGSNSDICIPWPNGVTPS